MFVVFISVFLICNGLLVDSSTTGSPAILSNEIFTMLMNLLNAEIQSRRNLETMVTNLQHDIISTKQEVAEKDKVITHMNTTLEKRFGDTEKERKLLLDSDVRLQGTYDSLNTEFKQLNQTRHQLDTVTLQTILKWQNDTKELAYHVQATNSRLNSVINEGNTRNRDLLLLYNKVDATERKLENETTLLHQQLVSNPNRATVTICLDHDRYFTRGHVITFNEIMTQQGITDLESLRHTGIFTCEKDGLYLISAFVQTTENNTGFKIYKNNERITSAYVSVKGTDHYQTSTAVVIEHLSVNDKVSVTAEETSLVLMKVKESCLSVLQVS